MLKEFAQYLVSLKDNKTYEIGGETYSDHELHRIVAPVARPQKLNVSGLDSIVKLIRTEIEVFKEIGNIPLYIRVDSEKRVSVFTTYDTEMERDFLYCAEIDAPGFREGFREYEKAIIELRSRFAPGQGVEYLLDLLSRITKDRGVSTEDNGVTQKVEARAGIALKQMENIKPRVSLCPFRTFQEVDQPESEFLVRLDGDGNVGLFEADGGMWKLDAKKKIAAYFSSALNDFIEAGTVVVMI